MSRPVQYNIYGQTSVKLVTEGPEGYKEKALWLPTLIK
jgi:hypothetical protein